MTQKNMTHKIFRGVYPVVFTPQCEDQSVDYSALEELINYYADEGCHGVV